jgi:hypothetical protein
VTLGEPPCFLKGRVDGVGLRRTASGAQHFDCHRPVELSVVAEVHGAEAALPQDAPHLVCQAEPRLAQEAPVRSAGRPPGRG